MSKRTFCATHPEQSVVVIPGDQGLPGFTAFFHGQDAAGNLMCSVLPDGWQERTYHRLRIRQDDGKKYVVLYGEKIAV